MKRTLAAVTLAAAAGLYLGLARGDRNEDKEPPKEALALQETLQKTVADAEPAIACILVSRSKRYGEFSSTPPAPESGKLGGFKFDYRGLDRFRDRDRIELALKLDLSARTLVPESYGSGVVIDAKKRQVLTNYHVIRGATKLYVRLPGGQGSYANIRAADPRSDLAVLELISRTVSLKAIKPGDGGKVKKGQMVLTIANPFAAGFRDGSPSASWGIVSNLRRRAPISELDERKQNKNLHHYGTLIQTDTRINLGCSGGALIDLRGELIGLTTALAGVNGTDIPGGYAVPIDATMRRIIRTLQQGREVEYGFLGVTFVDAYQGKGVQLKEISPGSPASNVGLEVGDRIVSINGTPTAEINDVYLPLAQLPPGAPVKLGVVRVKNGVSKKLSFRPTLAKYAVQGPIIASNRRWFRGLRVDYTSLLVQRPLSADSLRPVPKGVYVCAVRPNGPAANKLLKVGDIITAVNGKEVNTPAAFYKKVSRLRAVRLTVEGRPKPVQLN
jgi:S1-C subfamily serine protease